MLYGCSLGHFKNLFFQNCFEKSVCIELAHILKVRFVSVSKGSAKKKIYQRNM